ncbi:MAG: hypothetical protein LC722_01860 [Actinobacteria bacterium]|nr:hypothetical protein [Actinomycetota bacterium]
MNPQSLEQANAVLAVAAEQTGTGEVIGAPLAELARAVGLPSPLSLARAVRALVSRGRIASEDGEYRLLDPRPLELGEKVSVAPRRGRRTRATREAGPGDDGLPTYADLGRALVDRLIELARETAAISELTDVRRELREERSARVRAEDRATELHARARDLEAKLDMAEENLRRVIGVVRQQTTSAKPADPEAQALLAILRGSASGEAGEDEEPAGPGEGAL